MKLLKFANTVYIFDFPNYSSHTALEERSCPAVTVSCLRWIAYLAAPVVAASRSPQLLSSRPHIVAGYCHRCIGSLLPRIVAASRFQRLSSSIPRVVLALRRRWLALSLALCEHCAPYDTYIAPSACIHIIHERLAHGAHGVHDPHGTHAWLSTRLFLSRSGAGAA